jgi:hypothetical protein
MSKEFGGGRAGLANSFQASSIVRPDTSSGTADLGQQCGRDHSSKSGMVMTDVVPQLHNESVTELLFGPSPLSQQLGWRGLKSAFSVSPSLDEGLAASPAAEVGTEVTALRDPDVYLDGEARKLQHGGPEVTQYSASSSYQQDRLFVTLGGPGSYIPHLNSHLMDPVWEPSMIYRNLAQSASHSVNMVSELSLPSGWLPPSESNDELSEFLHSYDLEPSPSHGL